MFFLPEEVVFRSDPILSQPGELSTSRRPRKIDPTDAHLSPPPALSSFAEMAQLYMGFLEVSIISLLYHRHVYPSELFEPAQKWGTPCWSSKTISLASYVGGLVDSLADDFTTVSLYKLRCEVRSYN